MGKDSGRRVVDVVAFLRRRALPGELLGWAGALLIALITTAHAASASDWLLFTDSDSLTPVMLTSSILGGQAQDWAMSPVLFVPETAVYAALSVLGLGVRATLVLASIVNVLALYGALRYAAGAVRTRPSAIGLALLASAAIAVLTLLEDASRPGYRLATLLATTTYYSATVVAGVLTVGIAARFAAPRPPRRAVTAYVLLGSIALLSTFTNPIYAPWTIAPVVGVTLLWWWRSRRVSRPGALALGVMIAGAAVGYLLRIPLSPWIVADQKNYVRPQRILAAIDHYGRLFLDGLTTPAGVAWTLILVGMWVVAVVLAVRGLRGSANARGYLALYAALTPPFTLLWMIVLGTDADRYLQPLLYAPAVGLLAAPLPALSRVVANRVVPASAVALVAVTAFLTPSLVSSASAVDADLRCVTQWVEKSGRVGAGQFWTIRAPKAYVSDPRMLVQVDQSLRPYNWMVDRDDYAAAAPSFLVVDANSYPFDTGGLRPTSVVPCGRYSIQDFQPATLPLR